MVRQQESMQNSEFVPDYYNSFMNQQREESRVGLAQELDPQKALVETIQMLRGEIEIPHHPKITFKRVLNETGVSAFIHMVRGAANSINTYSNYRTDEKIIYRIMQKWVSDIIYEFYYNRQKYFVEGSEESEVSIVINLAVGLMLPSFFKALAAGDRSAVTRTIQEQITRALRQEGEIGPIERRKGFLARMNPFSSG